MAGNDPSRFENLTFEQFRKLASDPGLSKYEKIGFPDSYRDGYADRIFEDIRSKLANLDARNKRVLDVGPGLSDLPVAIIEHCRSHGHRLTLIDSPEMLAGVPDFDFIEKVPGRFPQDCGAFLLAHAGAFDAILSYSVLQYAFVESSVFDFVDQMLLLLAEGGQLLLGDIPNVDKRKRFFSSRRGIDHHKHFTGRDEAPLVECQRVEVGKIDDAVVMGLVSRCRRAGYDAYVVPQGTELPMSNRREDLLITRP
ncbi:MAG TPA: class I SAM-dependent methyltransferase [Casimicrobiaceae bacterium]|nr:class I SAM-dependent methyltransferase [Casimicrobiaceae bacterium]